MRLRRSINIFLGIILTILLLNSCKPKNGITETGLTAHFDQFPVLAETQHIDFSDPSSRRHYVSGWFFMETAKERQISRTEENKASLKFFLHSQKKISLAARLNSNQTVHMEAAWNGSPLPSKKIDQGGSEIIWDLDPEWIQTGINILDLSFSPIEQDTKRKFRIDLIDASFSPLTIDPEPELSVSASSQSIKMQGPLCLYFYLRTLRSSKLNFAYQCQNMETKQGRLKISVSPPDNSSIIEKNLKLSPTGDSEWKQVSIDLSRFDDQLIRVEIQHLAEYADLTEIKQPVLTGNSSPEPKRKVMLLGVDGAAWEVIDPLIAQGKLPHFQQLIESGASGKLRSVLPMYSPLIWTSIVTGKTKEKHGITGFVEQQENKDEIIPNSRLSRKCLTLWNILGNERKVVGVVGPWVTWPAEKVNGFLLTDRIYFEKLPETAFPGEFMNFCQTLNDSLQQNPGDPFFTGLLDRLKPDQMNLRSPVLSNITLETNYLWQDHLKNEAGLILNSFFDPEFYYLYLRAPDVTSHFFWKYYQPDDTVFEEEIEQYESILPSVYMHVDKMIGQQLEKASKDTTIIVVSDHGMGPKSYTTDIAFNHINKLWKQIGIRQNISTTEIKRFQIILSFPDQKTKKEAEISLRQVALGQEKEPLFKIYDSGKPDVLSLEISKIYNLDGCSEVFYKSKKTGELDNYASLREISGDHTLYGILIMKGPDIKSGHRLKDYSVLDIAPTILALLDLPVPRDMDGDIIEEAILPDYKTKHPFRFIESYEGRRSKTATEDGQRKMDEESKKEILERLRSLGYIK